MFGKAATTTARDELTTLPGREKTESPKCETGERPGELTPLQDACSVAKAKFDGEVFFIVFECRTVAVSLQYRMMNFLQNGVRGRDEGRRYTGMQDSTLDES